MGELQLGRGAKGRAFDHGGGGEAGDEQAAGELCFGVNMSDGRAAVLPGFHRAGGVDVGLRSKRRLRKPNMRIKVPNAKISEICSTVALTTLRLAIVIGPSSESPGTRLRT